MRIKILVLLSLGLLFIMILPSLGRAAERIRFATPAFTEAFHLPLIAAQEQKIWEKHALNVEWVEIRGAAATNRSLAAGSVEVGVGLSVGMAQPIARGVPIVITMTTMTESFYVWVSSKGRIAKPMDLKGTKIGVSSLGGGVHALARTAIKGLGIDEKEVRFVGTGGPRESLAVFKTGAVDALVYGNTTMVAPKLAGEARELLTVNDFLPKRFALYVFFARKKILQDNPETVKKVALALLEAIRFVRSNPDWSIQKSKTVFGRGEEGARLISQKLHWTEDGKISREDIEGVRSWAIEYGLVKKEEMPPVDQFFTAIVGN